ncbi:hypothetical protein EW146_g3490 [Bondarzewia mesenterica]|uniref:CxC2-like cysteine cluster KDZ transposase-associated domain-containing protein n=1 Tax=Bondarzewia mesenterica TaxID=1095465 RepID=A0A4S4LXV1_9AGAM|nr:hypothetical protein EW146_g3490 [Bondarzewia mesenterica]
MPEGLKIIKGIGVWHIHGHQDQCFCRFYPGFIKGVALVDGKIIETLWAPLNQISGSTRTMATSHRRETLDAHMADSNWKKWICMNAMLIAEWTLQEEAAFASRDSHSERLDIYDVAKAKSEQRHSDSLPSVDHVAVPGRAAYQLNLTELEKENRQDLLHGTAAWLSTGLKIQEAQYVYSDCIRIRRSKSDRISLMARVHRLSRRASAEALLEIEDAWRWLEARIAKFHQDAVTYVSEIEDPGEWQDLPADVHLDPVLDSEDDASEPEVAQDVAKSQRKKTRAWNEVTALEGNVREYAQIYSACRLTMLHLEADDDILTMYKELNPEHLKASTAISNPSKPGYRKMSLAWFWNMDVDRDTEGNGWMEEFYRVHWLRAKALRDRWQEQVMLLAQEMEWMVHSFKTKADTWGSLMESFDIGKHPGHHAYAARQQAMWNRFGLQAMDEFNKAKFRRQ